MSSSAHLRAVTIVRWIARIWSVLLCAIALLVIIVPDPYAVKPVPLTDWVELGLYGVALVGLLIAWRWEGLGGAIAVAGVVGHGMAFRIFRGYWGLRLRPSSALLGLVFLLPAVLFLVCWALSRGKRKLAGPTNGVSAES